MIDKYVKNWGHVETISINIIYYFLALRWQDIIISILLCLRKKIILKNNFIVNIQILNDNKITMYKFKQNY